MSQFLLERFLKSFPLAYSAHANVNVNSRQAGDGVHDRTMPSEMRANKDIYQYESLATTAETRLTPSLLSLARLQNYAYISNRQWDKTANGVSTCL